MNLIASLIHRFRNRRREVARAQVAFRDPAEGSVAYESATTVGVSAEKNIAYGLVDEVGLVCFWYARVLYELRDTQAAAELVEYIETLSREVLLAEDSHEVNLPPDHLSYSRTNVPAERSYKGVLFVDYAGKADALVVEWPLDEGSVLYLPASVILVLCHLCETIYTSEWPGMYTYLFTSLAALNAYYREQGGLRDEGAVRDAARFAVQAGMDWQRNATSA
jgi:hypothetical protein